MSKLKKRIFALEKKIKPEPPPVIYSETDEEAAEKRFALVKDFPRLEINESVESLAAVYVDKLKIPPKAEADTIHIALSCMYEVDYLMTWNCSHIANGRIIKQLQKINTEQDVKTPIICTPGELLEIDYGE